MSPPSPPGRPATANRAALRSPALPLIGALLAAACGGLQPLPEAPRPAEIPELRAEVEERPDAVEPRVRLGAAYRVAEQPEDARRTLVRARRLDPDHALAAYLLGLTYEDLGRYGEARAVYEDYLRASEDPYLRTRIERRMAYVDRREMEASLERALRREGKLAERTPPENTVAVFPFLYRGESPRFEPLGRALAAFLITDLTQSERVTVLERARVQLLLQEMELAESGYVDPATAVRSGRLLGTSRVVQGLLRGDEPSLEVEASLVDARGPPPEQLEPAFTGERPAERIMEVEAEIALAVFGSLGVELTPAERQRIRERPTENLEAVLAFGRGLMAEDTANFSAAARHYRRAGEIDPGFEEAREHEERARELSVSSEEGTGELTLAAFRQPPGIELSEVGRRTGETGRDELSVWWPIRDPLSELLGVEGLSDDTGLLRIIIPPPGGGGGGR